MCIWCFIISCPCSGTLLQEEDLVPGSGAAEMVTDMTNTTYLADVGIGCTGTLTGGART